MTSPIEAFAAQLRALRADAGAPSFRQLAKQTHFSASTLAEAASGRRLPSSAVVRALAEAYGADPDEWAAKLAVAADTVRPPRNGAHVTGSTPSPTRRLPRWVAVTVLAVTAFAGGTGFGLAIARPSSATLSPSPGVPAAAATGAASSAPPGSQPANDGQDPVVAGCTGDAQVLGRVDVIHERAQIGIVELKFSRTCGAGWARLYLVEGAPAMFATVQIAAGDGTATSLTMFVKDAGPAGAIYTNVLTAHGRCLSASAILEPVVPQHVSAATPCTPPPR